MEQLELEGIAAGLLREGHQDGDDVPRLGALVGTLLGPDSVALVPNLRGDGALARVNGVWRIYLRRGLSVERKTFAIAHELAEWWLKVREHYEGDDLERAADFIGAAIVAPRRAFMTALREIGDDFPELAARFRTTETHVALREAEITMRPRAVVTPALVRVRGPETWVWPAEATVRGWARKPGPGLRAAKLTDDPKRTVIDVADPDADVG